MTFTEDSYQEQHNIEQTQTFRLNFQVNKEMLDHDVTFERKIISPFISHPWNK